MLREAAAHPLSPRGREVWRLWEAVSSQWRVGFGGAYGLDYAAVRVAAEWLGIEIGTYEFRLLRHLETDQLAAWAAKRGEEEARRSAENASVSGGRRRR